MGCPCTSPQVEMFTFLLFFTVKVGESAFWATNNTDITWKYLRQTLGMDTKARPEVRKRVRNGPMDHGMPLYPAKLEEKPLLTPFSLKGYR